ncbi:hypothetical protein [Flavobacterium sp. 3HN19-14]|uniref:hypothetical protein n=1 Tax=Flavobacterium sp. 3HN19-14 TaxID=3448133 RepID=UPI003EE280BC
MYTVEMEDINEGDISYSRVTHLATNANNEIYALGHHLGRHDFGDGQQETVYNSPTTTAYFIMKLDEDKNILWVKQFNPGGRYEFGSIVIGDSGDLFISGYAEPVASELYLDPNPINPTMPNVYAPTHENLIRNHSYGFVVKLDADGNYITHGVTFFDVNLAW